MKPKINCSTNLKIVQVDINKYHANNDKYSSGNFYRAQQSF